MKKIDRLCVFFNNGSQKTLVGTLALFKNRFAAFSYSDIWLKTGFSISPFSLPLEKKVFIPEWEAFGGLHGIFNDSLPDGWGRLLVDRMITKAGGNPAELSVLDRLAIVGSLGMGALTYEPESFLSDTQILSDDFDKISAECERILNSELSDSENLDAIFAAGGSSGGARPKVFAKIGGEDWIVKFPSSVDSKEIGKQEYDYNICAKNCGVEVSDVKLFASKKCSGYFGTKRFDRNYFCKGRILMASASALLETSHRIPNLDYNTLENEKRWFLSPAYDLTYSNSIGGEHATTIDGEGKNPNIENILAVAKKNGIKLSRAKEIAEEIEASVKKDLSEYLIL